MNGGPSQMDLLDYKPGLGKSSTRTCPSPSEMAATDDDDERAGAFPHPPSSTNSSSTAKPEPGSAKLLSHTAEVADDLL